MVEVVIFLSGDGLGKMIGELLHSLVPRACLWKKSWTKQPILILSSPALRTPAWCGHAIITDGQFALSPGKESPYIFTNFNPLNTPTTR